MPRKKKIYAPGELSAIRRAAAMCRKTFGAGGNYRTVDPQSKSCTVRASVWAAQVFASRAKANGITVRQALDRVAATIARQHGMAVPEFAEGGK